MRRPSLLVAAALLCAAVVVPAARPQPACATGGPHAALVVDTGSRVLALCVALDAERVSGLHLIELAGSQYGLSYSFGLGGQAVCMLAGVGTPGDDCFARY